MIADWSCIRNSDEICEGIMEAKTVHAIYRKNMLHNSGDYNAESY